MGRVAPIDLDIAELECRSVFLFSHAHTHTQTHKHTHTHTHTTACTQHGRVRSHTHTHARASCLWDRCRCSRTLQRWTRHVVEERMRERVEQKSIGTTELLALCDTLHAASVASAKATAAMRKKHPKFPVGKTAGSRRRHKRYRTVWRSADVDSGGGGGGGDDDDDEDEDPEGAADQPGVSSDGSVDPEGVEVLLPGTRASVEAFLDLDIVEEEDDESAAAAGDKSAAPAADAVGAWVKSMGSRPVLALTAKGERNKVRNYKVLVSLLYHKKNRCFIV
jgi:hypothetical protein